MFRSQRGQVASEYLGLLLVVAAIVGALAAGGLGTRIAEHARAAVCTIAGESCAADGADPGEVDPAAVDRAAADLRGLLGQAPAPAAVAALFSDLDPQVAQALALEHPELVGNIDGAPIGLRYAANATAIDSEIARLQAAGVSEDDARLRKLRELDNPDRHFLLFDPAGDGRLAEVFGDLEHARHIAVVVPGMNNELNNFNGGNADRVQAQASEFDPGQVATIQWLGYDTPEGATALGEGAAEPGARDLPNFVDGIRAQRAERLHWTVVAHSYGSLVAGKALSERGFEVDEVVFVGSPGVGVNSRSSPSATRRCCREALPACPSLPPDRRRTLPGGDRKPPSPVGRRKKTY
jgi:hypothetical protein